MKYVLRAAIGLSCLLFIDAAKSGAHDTTSSTIAIATTTRISKVSSIDVTDSLTSALDIKVASIDALDDSEFGNSPALEEEDRLNEEDAEETEEGLATVDGNVDENMFASAGLVYNKDNDLPVYSKGAATSDEDYPPIPQVVACRGQGQVAITYSEGPSDTTARIARQLNKASATANFFVNTNWLNQQQYAMVLQNIYNAGHMIGMTYRLPNEEPEAMSDEEIKADIVNSARKVESLIGVSPKYVRLHFSAQNDGRAEHMLRDLGFILVGYNLDGKDYVHKSGELVAEEYGRTFREYTATHDNKGSFVSIQYDIPETSSLDAIPHILKMIASEGYSAVRMDGCLNDNKPYKATAGGLEYVADKFSYGSPGYRSGQKLMGTSIITSNATIEDGIKGLSANDDFLSGGASFHQVREKIGFALIPVLLFAFMF